MLTNASCALASLHNKTLRVSRMLEQPDPVPQQSTASQLYDRAFWLLANKTSAISASLEQPPALVGEKPNYSVSEVLGALHCVAYFLMQGGIGEWSAPLSAARYWLEKTAEGAEDPKRMYLSMSEAERLAVKMTIVSCTVNLAQITFDRSLFGACRSSSASLTRISCFVSGMIHSRRYRCNKPPASSISAGGYWMSAPNKRSKSVTQITKLNLRAPSFAWISSWAALMVSSSFSSRPQRSLTGKKANALAERSVHASSSDAAMPSRTCSKMKCNWQMPSCNR